MTARFRSSPNCWIRPRIDGEAVAIDLARVSLNGEVGGRGGRGGQKVWKHARIGKERVQYLATDDWCQRSTGAGRPRRATRSFPSEVRYLGPLD